MNLPKSAMMEIEMVQKRLDMVELYVLKKGEFRL